MQFSLTDLLDAHFLQAVRQECHIRLVGKQLLSEYTSSTCIVLVNAEQSKQRCSPPIDREEERNSFALSENHRFSRLSRRALWVMNPRVYGW